MRKILRMNIDVSCGDDLLFIVPNSYLLDSNKLRESTPPYVPPVSKLRDRWMVTSALQYGRVRFI